MKGGLGPRSPICFGADLVCSVERLALLQGLADSWSAKRSSPHVLKDMPIALVVYGCEDHCRALQPLLGLIHSVMLFLDVDSLGPSRLRGEAMQMGSTDK